MKKSKGKRFFAGCFLFIAAVFLITIGINLYSYLKFWGITKVQEGSSAGHEESYDYNGTGVAELIPQEVLDEYLEYLAPADDEHDFRYASDYQDHELVKLKKAYDCSGYEHILGYADASLEDIQESLNRNPNITEKYKRFIYDFACDLRGLYPGAWAWTNWNFPSSAARAVSSTCLRQAISDSSIKGEFSRWSL